VDQPDTEVFPPISIPKDGVELPHQTNGEGATLSPETYRERVVIVAACRAAGYSYERIQKLTGLSERQCRYAMTRARQDGIKQAELSARIDDVALPLAVEGLIDILGDPTNDHFYAAIRDTLYGRGEFRNHSHSVSDNRNVNLTMTVEYEMPDGAAPPQVVQVTDKTGLMVGRPREDPPEGHNTRRD
jgi:hypothetical protein